MFIKYKEEQENAYYNLVLYKKDNQYRIYTLKIETSKKLYGKGTTASEEILISVKPGIIPLDGWVDSGDDSTTGGGDYEYQCRVMGVEVDVFCTGAGTHTQNDLNCDCEKTIFTCKRGYTQYKIKEICEYVWVGTGNEPNYTGNVGTGNIGNGGGTGTSDTGNTIDVKAVNPSDVIPEGADSTDFINSVLSQQSPFNVDVTQVLDSISLPPNDSTKIANEKFLCLYKKITKSNTYKNLFTNIFGGSQDVLNVEFKVTKNLKFNGGKANGLRSVLPGSTRVNGVITKLNMLIEIDQGLLDGDSNYNAIKTILHESIHAFLTLKKLTCNNQVALDSYNNDDVSKTINTLFNSFCTGNLNQHDFMFNKMLPAFKTIFEEIGKLNFTSQASIDYVETNPLPLDNNTSVTWSWGNFYNYFPMQGLHNTDSFKTEIKNNPTKKILYEAYSDASRNFSKNCN